jgi:2-polyprenyl-6-methoxyphenol hydroxylase-like FAD-dependent oxidoreductase
VTDRTTKTVTIIGAGIGGLYLLAELGFAGFKLRLHVIDDSKVSEIRARGGVDVEGERAGSPLSTARRPIFPQLLMGPMSSSL